MVETEVLPILRISHARIYSFHVLSEIELLAVARIKYDSYRDLSVRLLLTRVAESLLTDNLLSVNCSNGWNILIMATCSVPIS